MSQTKCLLGQNEVDYIPDEEYRAKQLPPGAWVRHEGGYARVDLMQAKAFKEVTSRRTSSLPNSNTHTKELSPQISPLSNKSSEEILSLIRTLQEQVNNLQALNSTPPSTDSTPSTPPPATSVSFPEEPVTSTSTREILEPHLPTRLSRSKKPSTRK